MPDKRRWAVIWDVDGTLVDTAELHFQAWLALAREIGMPYTRQDFAGTFGWRNAEIIPKVFGLDYNAPGVPELGERKEYLYRAEARKGVALLPGAGPLLTAIHAHGGRQAIGSSAPRANVDLILEATGTAALFDAVIAMEDTQRGKPDPQVFLLGAERLGVEPSRCIVFEDAPVGIAAARAGGMRAVGVTFVGHHSADKLRAAGADRIVKSLEELDCPTLVKLVTMEQSPSAK